MAETFQIDINADVGEGIDNESEIMPYLSSCNIACEGHAGDDYTMREAVRLAKKHNVKIGAHPSFPDKVNFGRVVFDISDVDLYVSILSQTLVLKYIAEEQGVVLNHIKPHGALYNLAAKNEKTAKVIVNVIKRMEQPVKLYAPYNSIISEIAKNENIEVIYEGFADRNYNEDLSLVSRKNDNALLSNKDAILQHVLRMIKYQKIKTISGEEESIKASTLCVHGDTKNAIEILKYLNLELPKNRIKIQ